MPEGCNFGEAAGVGRPPFGYSGIVNRVPGFGCPLVRLPHGARRRAVAVCAAAAAIVASFAVAAGVGEGTLELRGGHGVPGRLAPASVGGGPRETLLWESPLFAAPLEFHLDELVGVRFKPGPAAKATPALRFTLRGGDALEGDLVALDAEAVVIRPPSGWEPTPLRIERAAVEGISRADGPAAGQFSGPGDLEAWSVAPAGAWRAEVGGIRAAEPSVATRTIPAAARSWFEIAISWRVRPELRISVAAGEAPADDPYWVELLTMLDGLEEAAVVRKESDRAAIESLDCGPSGQTSLRLAIFVDQAAGRLVAFRRGEDGVAGPAAEVVLPAASREVSGRLRLTLGSGDVRIDGLRSGPWTAAEPVVDDRGSVRVTTREGQVIEATDVSYDAAASTFVAATARGPQRVRLDDVAGVSLPADAGDGRKVPPAVRVAVRSGAAVAGDLLAADADALTLQVEGIAEPVRVPLAEIAAVTPLQARAAPREAPGRVGILEADGASIPGCVVDGADVAAGIAFHPQGGVRAVPLAVGPETAATLEYVPRAAADSGELVEVGGIGGMVNQNADGVYVVTMLSDDGAAANDGRLQAGDQLLAVKPRPEGGFVTTRGLDATTVMNLLRGRVDTPVVIRVATAGGPPRDIDLMRGPIHLLGREVLEQALDTHLRLAAAVQRDAGALQPARAVLLAGDIVPCEIIGIAANRVRLKTSVVDGGADSIEVAGDLLRAVELEPAAPPRELSRAIVDRLLTLPRSQRAEPPTHLVRLLDGDYLRGRLESLDAETLAIDVRGAVKRLPRSSVARIIWLHPEGDDEPGAADPAAARPAGLLVQGVAGAGRVTLVAESCVDGVIRGTSPALGPGRIDLATVDRLLVGGAIATEADELPYRQWRLRPAAEPRALREEAGTAAETP